MHDVAPVIALVGAVIFLAHLFSVIFEKTRIPDVLLLILIGLVLGPLTGLVKVSDFGAIGPVFTAATLVLVLFEAGTGLKLAELRQAARGTVVLTLATFTASALLVTGIAMAAAGLDFPRALMLGVCVGSTSPAVIVTLARHLGLRVESRTILLLESTLSDVLSVVVFVAILEGYRFGQVNIGITFGKVIASFLLAVICGVAGAVAWSLILRRLRALENSLFLTVAFVFIIFALVEFIGYSGAIAALAFGVTLGNIERMPVGFIKRYASTEPVGLNSTEKTFFSEISFLLRAMFFVYAGISLQVGRWELLLLGLGLTVLMFLLRIPIVRYTLDRRLSRRDASMMAAMVPKGLAAAVLASIPLQQGIEGGDIIQNVSYAVVLFSIVITSLLVFLIDRTRVADLYGRALSNFRDWPLDDGDRKDGNG
jgi:NhaP-type Na+/H+ or K+/H+ antiporter